MFAIAARLTYPITTYTTLGNEHSTNTTVISMVIELKANKNEMKNACL